MTPSPSVRRAGVADVAVVAELLDRFNREYGAATPGPAILGERLAQLLPSGRTFALLAGEPALGVALLTLRTNVWCDGPVALLDELYVLPGERSRGLGSALLAAAEALCLAQGCELLEINVDGPDADARRFYERHGYRDREPGQSGPELYYRRALGAPGGA